MLLGQLDPDNRKEFAYYNDLSTYFSRSTILVQPRVASIKTLDDLSVQDISSKRTYLQKCKGSSAKR